MELPLHYGDFTGGKPRALFMGRKLLPFDVLFWLTRL